MVLVVVLRLFAAVILFLIFFYCSPRGDRVRSRVELVSVLEGFLDLATFDYKTGKFYDGQAPPTRVRNRAKVLGSFST